MLTAPMFLLDNNDNKYYKNHKITKELVWCSG